MWCKQTWGEMIHSIFLQIDVVMSQQRGKTVSAKKRESGWPIAFPFDETYFCLKSNFPLVAPRCEWSDNDITL